MAVRIWHRTLLSFVAGLAIAPAGGCATPPGPTAGAVQVVSHPADTQPDGTIAPAALPAQRTRIILADRSRARRVMALPASWDQANVTFNSPTRLTAPSVVQIPMASFMPAGATYVFTGDQLSTPKMPLLRPGTDYTVMADLESTAPGLTLEAYGVAPGVQTIDAGPNAFTITLAPTGNQGAESAVSTSAGNQATPAVAYDGGTDQYLVVWVDAGKILASLVDNAGSPGGAITVCNSGTASAPAVAFNASANKFMVTWADTRNGHSDVFFNTVTTAGAAGTETALDHVPGHTASETQPTIAAGTGADRFLIAWVDDRNNATTGKDIYAYRVASTGALSAEIAVAVSAGATDQLRPIACHAATVDRFVVGFEDGGDLRFQRISALTGATMDGAMGSTLTSAAGVQDQLSLAFNGKDDLVMAAWRDARSAPTQIYYAILDPSGGGVALADTALTSGAATASQPLAGFCSAHGDYAVMYADNRNAGQLDLFLDRIKRDGVTSYGEKVISTVAGAQRPGGLAYGATSDQFLATWEDDRAIGTNGTDIYAQRVR